MLTAPTQIRSLLLFAGTYFKSLINIQRRKCLGGGGKRMWFHSRTGSDSNPTSLLDAALSGGMRPWYWKEVLGQS